MSREREDFVLLAIKEIAKYLKNKIQKTIGDIRVAIFLTFLLLLFDQVIIACQKPSTSIANSVESARKTNSYIGKCKVHKIELIDGYVLPKKLDLKNYDYHLISRFEEKRLLLSWFYYENLDEKYLFYDEFSIYDEIIPYLEGKIPYLQLTSENKKQRKTMPSNSHECLKLENYKAGDSLRLDMTEIFWNKRSTKIIGKITLACNCEFEE